MGWTTPKTWTSEPLTSSDLNEQLRDNLDFLYAAPSFYEPNTSNYTTTSTTLTSIDATDGTFSHTITSIGGNILIYGMLAVSVTGTGATVYFDIEIDGTSISPGSYLFANTQQTSASIESTGVMCPVSGLSDASHTVELKWRVAAGTATLYAGSGGYQSRFGVMRLG